MFARLLRVAYAIEFLTALIAALELWREAGGQGHLDLMPWYWKFFFSLGLAGAIVKMTAALVTERRRATILWSLATVAILMAGGLVTYYFHVNEPVDSDDESPSLSARLEAPRPI